MDTQACTLKCSERKYKIVRPRISVKTETNSPSLSEMPIPRRQWNEIVRSRTRSCLVTSRERYFLSDKEGQRGSVLQKCVIGILKLQYPANKSHYYLLNQWDKLNCGAASVGSITK